VGQALSPANLNSPHPVFITFGGPQADGNSLTVAARKNRYRTATARESVPFCSAYGHVNCRTRSITCRHRIHPNFPPEPCNCIAYGLVTKMQ
jgi:hypothetical protein